MKVLLCRKLQCSSRQLLSLLTNIQRETKYKAEYYEKYFQDVGRNQSALEKKKKKKTSKGNRESANQVHLQPLVRCSGEKHISNLFLMGTM